MTLELFGWILVAVGLFLFVYGYLKASKRIDVEEQWRRGLQAWSRGVEVLPHVNVRPEDAPPSPDWGWPRVTEQEKREALRVASRVRLHDFDDVISSTEGRGRLGSYTTFNKAIPLDHSDFRDFCRAYAVRPLRAEVVPS